MTNKFLFLALISTLLLLTSCDKDDPEIPNDEEIITTLNYMLTPNGGGTTITLSFQDLDGDGGNNATITGGTLTANETYTGTMELLNESVTPTEDITEEIVEEAEDHQFFFTSDVSGLTIAYDDGDTDQNPIGLNSTVTTAGLASGNLTIILKHKPEKSAVGVADGDITNAGGETDIEVTFPIDVQ